MMKKTAIFTYAKAPYRNHQFNEFVKITNHQIDVFYLEKKITREWNVNSQEKLFKEYYIDDYSLFKLIRAALRYDQIIFGGYEIWKYVVVGFFAKLKSIKTILMFDGINPQKITSQNRVKYFVKKIIMNIFSYFFVNGTVSKNYFINTFNVPENRIFNQYLSIHTSFFDHVQNNNYFNDLRKQGRDKLNISIEDFVICYSGRILKRKNIHGIVDSIAKLQCKNIILLVLGGGNEQATQELLAYAENNNINIVITGFIAEQKELFALYYAADLFILNSDDEPWGLAINEAIAAGLPVITSKNVGASLDLVAENKNGFVVNNQQELKEKIQYIISSKKWRIKAKRYSLEISSKWTFNHSAQEYKRISDI